MCKHIQTWIWHTGKVYELKNNANQEAFSKGTSENINTQNFINYFEEIYPVLDLL